MRKIVRSNTHLLSILLNSSKEGLNKFRYFKSRHLEIIDSHLISFIILDNDIPSGYCHLEEENNKLWLGVLVSDNFLGKGLGSYCLDILTKISDLIKRDLYLSVDKDNLHAIYLYKKFGFNIIEEKKELFFMHRNFLIREFL
jgi:GNAT superfamily N-acetyltransferase